MNYDIHVLHAINFKAYSIMHILYLHQYLSFPDSTTAKDTINSYTWSSRTSTATILNKLLTLIWKGAYVELDIQWSVNNDC